MTAQKDKTILLVEDDTFTAVVTKMQIQKFGYNVVVANSGEDAVKMAKEYSNISLILMDIDLGGIDGTETAKEILTVRHIPIVFLTAHTEEDYVKRVKEITRYGYVVKNSGAFVLKSSIEMAFELFNEYKKTKESEEKYHLLFETMSPGVVYQTAEGHIISANPSAEKILGLTLEQMQGRTSSDPRWRMITEEGIELKGTEHPAMIALETGQKVGPVIRGVFIPEKNEYVWIYVTAIPLFRPGEDKPYQVYATFEDITEKKKADESLEKTEKELRQLNETKDKFFSIIAHDLRNPINAFISSTQILKDHLKTSVDEYAKMLSNEIYKTSQRLHELLENLLEWSQMQRGLITYKPVKIDFFFIADYVLNLLSENAKQKHIDLQCLIKEGTFVYVDYYMLQNILTNLLSNAIKFTNGGGKITIDSKDVGDFVEISVTDTGMGMTPEKIARLFKAGEQNISTLGTEGERGTGLGLILCKEFVEKNGGQIWVESHVGIGSKLKFTLPI